MGDKVFDISTLIVAALQPNQIFQCIQFGLAALMILVGIAYKFWKWYKEAKADGKISKDEVKDLINDTKEDVKDLAKEIENIVYVVRDDEKQ